MNLIKNYLDKNYPTSERTSVKKLNLNTFQPYEEKFAGKLDLTGFTSLEELDCSNNNFESLDLSNNGKLKKLNCHNNNLTDLDISNCDELEEVILYQNKLKVNLDIFSHLTKIKKLFIGFKGNRGYLQGNKWLKDENDFDGSLKNLENCKELEFLNIRNQENIKGGLESLPTGKLTSFDCEYTDYTKELESFKGINNGRRLPMK